MAHLCRRCSREIVRGHRYKVHASINSQAVARSPEINHGNIKMRHSPASHFATLNNLHNQKRAYSAGAVWLPDNHLDDPLDALQPFLEVPLIPPSDRLFEPSREDLEKGQKCLKAQRGEKLIPLKGAIKPEDLEDLHIPEVAFIGRSNVGKSSLIKALFHQPEDVRIPTSKKPGHTKVLKQYQLARRLSLVDMPGYGHNMPQYFVDAVEAYLQNRHRLVRTFLLIDAKVGLTTTDRTGLEMLEEFGRPYVLVLTKVDKASAHQLIKHVLSLLQLRERSLRGAFPRPFLVSAHENRGLAQLQAFIAHVTGHLDLAASQSAA